MNENANKAGRPVRVGVYASIKQADLALNTLQGLGFGREEISLVCPESMRSLFKDVDIVEPAGSHAAEAASVVGSIGAAIGGFGAAAVVASTGGAGLLVVGPLLSGAAAGAVTGGFVGAMMTRGVEPEIADYYDQALKGDKILISVEHSDPARLAEAEHAFEVTGAEPVRLTKG